MVLLMRPEVWWMLPMGVRCVKYESEIEEWRPGIGITSAGPAFQNLQFRAKSAFFVPKTALEGAENGQTKGNGGYTTHAARLPRAEGASRALQLHNMSANRPQTGRRTAKFVHIGQR